MSQDAPRFSPVIALLAVSAMWEGQLAAILKDLGITTRKFGLLGHIYAESGISFSELARRSHITVQSAHTAVRTLVDEGLVEDATAHAGAASDLHVTPKGAEVLQTAILEFTLPVLGDVKLVTSLFFDIGVYLVVVGLVLDILRSLGAELDRQVDEDDPIDAAPDEVIVR